MKSFRFLDFWLLLTLSMATLVFNSCDEVGNGPIDDPTEEPDPSEPSGPTGNTGIGPATSTTDPGVVINGIRWATRNIDKPGTFAAKPETFGMFYQWNAKIGWSSADPMINSNGGTVWVNSWTGNNASSWENSNNPCPAGWRIPTNQELQRLCDAGSVWTTENGVNGRLFGSMLGSGDKTVFLPAAGCRSNLNGALYGTGSDGYYWSSTQGYSSGAYLVGFRSGYAVVSTDADTRSNGGRAYGLSCRCVAE